VSVEASNGGQAITLDLSLEEARALKARMLKAAADGSSALDDDILQPTLLKLEHTLEYMDGVARVREELTQAGIEAAHLGDQQVAELGRRIAEARRT